MVLVNSGLHKRKNFSENYPQLGHASITSVSSPMLVQKNLKFWMDVKLLACPGRTHISRRPWRSLHIPIRLHGLMLH